ncbi:hypothetical protein OQA88_4986 [Cercophora sp. LCS_1]
MQFLPLVSKARKIYDLNNVPLVSGVSLIKWWLPHSLHHKEHRDRTSRCPIANHRVEYNYSKVVTLRIAIDKAGNLAECPIEFEVLQEFSVAGTIGGVTSRDEKVSLGVIRLNLSEYVEESEAILRDGSTTTTRRTSLNISGPGDKSGHQRKRSSMSADREASPRSINPPSDFEDELQAVDVQDGVVRRYLMQESKINSTLKISILLKQVDGERNYVAPALKTAPVFGGIAGFVANDALEPVDALADSTSTHVPSVSNKSRDVSELQDMYRRALAASWASQPGELPADQCIEDIFAGGDGFRSSSNGTSHAHSQSRHHASASSVSRARIGLGLGPSAMRLGNSPQSTSSSAGAKGSGSTSADEDDDMMGTLRPRDLAKMRHRLRGDSAASERSAGTTVLGDRERDHYHGRERGYSGGFSGSGSHQDLTRLLHHSGLHHHRRDLSRDTDGGGLRSRSHSATSLATTLGSSDRGRDGFKRAREVNEFEVREDLVAWAVSGGQS